MEYSKVQGKLMKIGGAQMFSDITKPRQYFDTGMPGLNYIISGSFSGGFPANRIVELYGNESNGKSTVAYEAISRAQKNGYVTVLIDTEGAFDASQAQRCDVDVDKMIYFEPASVDVLLNTVMQVIQTLYKDVPEDEKIPALIVWDSVAASSVLDAEKVEKSFDNNSAGQLARKISNGLNKLSPLVSHNPVCMLCLNQTRMDLQGFRPVITTPGGRSMKFYASVRVQIQKKGDYKLPNADGKEVKAGLEVEFMAAKNKIFRPFLKSMGYITFENGVETGMSLYDLACSYDIFESKGAWVEYNGEKRRKLEWLEALKNDKQFEQEIKDALDQRAKDALTPVREDVDDE